MKAAVVSETGRAPQWTDFADPVAGDEERLVTVAASALSPLARARAAGQHYSSAASQRFVAGVDGVGRLDDGSRVYFAFPRAPFGAIAEVVPVRRDLVTAIPGDLDDVAAAALANPAMSSWAALLDRAKMGRGESVLINGATGAAGALAVQIAKYLGAKTIVATGRSEQALSAAATLGADRIISLALPAGQLADALYTAIVDCGVTIVLDYLWGASALQIMRAIARNQSGDAAPRVRFVQIGAVSGAEISLDASLLRSSGIELLGTGLRSVALADLVRGIGEALAAATIAKFEVDTTTRPMVRVESAWNEDIGSRRMVFTC